MPRIALKSALRAVSFDAFGTLIVPAVPIGKCYAEFARVECEDRLGLGLVAVSPERVEKEFLRAYIRVGSRWGNFGQSDGLSSRVWWNQVVRQTLSQCTEEHDTASTPSQEETKVGGGDWMTDFPVSMEATNRLYDWYASSEAWRLRHRAKETLIALTTDGYKLAVLSNFDERLPGLLAQLGVADFMQTIIYSHKLPFMKPDPRIFHRLLHELGRLPPQALLHVGDSPEKDYRAARALGCSALLLEATDSSLTELRHIQAGRERPREQTGESSPRDQHYISNLYQVVDWLKRAEAEHQSEPS